MPKLPRLSGQETVAALERLGFEQVRQHGSHVILRRKNLGCVVPLHDELAVGTLRSILRLAGVTVDEFIKAVKG